MPSASSRGGAQVLSAKPYGSKPEVAIGVSVGMLAPEPQQARGVVLQDPGHDLGLERGLLGIADPAIGE